MDNEIVYREAELMYKMAPGFTPVNGNLKHWTGEIKFKSEDRVSNCLIDILLPENFPSSPPTVSSLTGLRHSTIDPATGRFALKILRDWKPKNHVYEIVNAIKDEFSRKSPKLLGSLKPISKPSAIREPPSYNSLKDLEVKIKDLEEEIEGLRKNIAEKNAEISRLQTVLKTKSLSSNLPAEQSPSD
ncbi:MAG: ubiquitin-conjugating enzyme E2, partial [Candidatus Odinarchaeota archaeon]